MAQTDVGTLLNRWFEEVWTQKNESKISELLDENGVVHALSAGAEDLVGPKGFIPFYKNFIQAFPDIKITVEETLTQGTLGSVRWLATGTHLGDLMGIPASG